MTLVLLYTYVKHPNSSASFVYFQLVLRHPDHSNPKNSRMSLIPFFSPFQKTKQITFLSEAVKVGLNQISHLRRGVLQRKSHFSQKLGLINVCEGSCIQSVPLQRGASHLSTVETHQEPNESVPHQKCYSTSVRLLLTGRGAPQRE